MQDKIEGKGQQIKGQVKEEVGKFRGDRVTEASGKLDQVKGEVQQKVGDAKINARKP
jgi:uncharacterized protein YjbJ (UPF0337 family)